MYAVSNAFSLSLSFSQMRMRGRKCKKNGVPVRRQVNHISMLLSSTFDWEHYSENSDLQSIWLSVSHGFVVPTGASEMIGVVGEFAARRYVYIHT